MLFKKRNERQIGFYSTFEEQLSRQHPLYLLAGKIQWEIFEKAFWEALFTRRWSCKAHQIDGGTLNAEAHSKSK